MGRERYDGRWGAVPCGRSSQLFVSIQPSELFSPRFCRVRFPVASYLTAYNFKNLYNQQIAGKEIVSLLAPSPLV